MPDDEVLSLSEGSDEQEWLEDEDEEEEEGVTIISLLDDRVFSDPFSMLSYCKEKYNLDFLGIRNRLGLDFHGTVKLINFSELLPSVQMSQAVCISLVNKWVGG